MDGFRVDFALQVLLAEFVCQVLRFVVFMIIMVCHCIPLPEPFDIITDA